jgi:hypothetical protein
VTFVAEEREMKLFVRSMGLAAGFLLLAGVQQARAQITDQVEFTTTFPFTVGYANVPAGTYSIRPDSDTTGILELSGAHVGVLFLTDAKETSRPSAKTEIVFQRYGEGYVLKDIFVEGSTTGAEALAAEAEKHLAKHGQSKGEHRVAARKKATTSNTP